MVIKIAGVCLAFIAGTSGIKELLPQQHKAPYSAFVTQTALMDTPDYRNFYGISWRGTPHDNLLYAKEMKYEYVFYQKNMELDTLSNGLYFYLESPDYLAYNRTIQAKKVYTAQQKTFYETFAALKNNTKPFPYNIANGWFFNDTTFSALPDFQQQAVINYVIDSSVNYAKAIEARNPRFHFGGLAWDVPQPSGDFWDTIQPPGSQRTLAYWTGSDAGVIAPTVTHNFSTYSEGHIQFYQQLFSKVRLRFPNARFMMEPYRLYEDWIQLIRTRPDAAQLMPDMLCQENPGTEFVNDSRVFADGLIVKNRVASTTPNKYGEADNRLIAAQAAMNGAWYNWFGRFGGTGDMPNYQNVNEVPPRLRLIRLLPSYENKNKTPLSGRSWNGTTYQSATAFADPKSIAVWQPGTNKYYVLLMNAAAEIPVPPGKSVTGIQRTNSFFMPIGDGSAELLVQAGKIKVSGSNSLNKLYIVYLN
jgi:hypothetical protein